MDDVDKLDNIQDGFIHYHLLRFCQDTRLQYLNGQIDLVNQNILQQQHVDHKRRAESWTVALCFCGR